MWLGISHGICSGCRLNDVIDQLYDTTANAALNKFNDLITRDTSRKWWDFAMTAATAHFSNREWCDCTAPADHTMLNNATRTELMGVADTPTLGQADAYGANLLNDADAATLKVWAS
jgi:hypothetical protein